MNNDYRILRRACGLAAVAAAFLAEPARSAVTGPYTVDANTLQLWHLNEGAAATSAANAVGGGLTMQGVLNGATLGNGSFAGFGTSLDVSAGSTALVSNDNPRVIMPPHRAILAGAPALSTLNGGVDPVDDALDDVSLTYADPTTGAFTFEMIVKFNAAYDPLQPFRNVGPLDPPSNPGSYSMELLTGEGDLDPSTRPFQFRLNQVGITSAGDAANPKLEFHNIALQTGAPLFGVIPLTGEHAINNTDWFHVAVAYNGNDFEADNIKFYWTKLAASVTQANQLATIDGTGAVPTTWATDLAAIAHDFAIGNESRNNGTGFGEGENFYGQIDEVRISGVARTASAFVFGPGGPTEDADFDEDGDVDGQDFLRWQRGLGLTGAAATLANGNANGDAAINGLDLAVWKAQFGVGGATGAAGAVPEAASASLACGALLSIGLVVGRKRGARRRGNTFEA